MKSIRHSKFPSIPTKTVSYPSTSKYLVSRLDVLMCLENGAEAEQRIKERPDLREIVEAVKVLRERQTHPFILENLNSQQYRQIAVRFGNYVVE